MLAVLAQVAGFFIARMIIDGVEVDGATVVLVVAGPVGLALGILAITRFEWFVWIVLAIRPTLDAFGGTGMGPGAMLAAAFLAAASVWLVVQIRAGQSRPLSPTSRAMLLFAGAVLAAVLTSQLRSTSALAALEIFAGITMFLVLEQLLAERPDRVRRLVTAVLAGAAVPLAVGLTQWIVGDSVGTRTDIGRIKSTFAHPNPFATYLVLVILLGLATATALHGRRRWLVGAYVLALGTMLVATYNRSGWIAVIVGLLYLGIRRSRWIIAGFVVAATVAVLAIPSIMDRIADLGGGEDFAYVPSDVPDNSFEWRVQYWESLIPMANESPITGLGPQVVVNTRPEKLEPHNVFVQTYVEIGLLGIVSLGAVVVTIGVELSRRRRACAR